MYVHELTDTDVRYSDVHSYFYDTPKQGETPAVVKVTHIVSFHPTLDA